MNLKLLLTLCFGSLCQVVALQSSRTSTSSSTHLISSLPLHSSRFITHMSHLEVSDMIHTPFSLCTMQHMPKRAPTTLCSTVTFLFQPRNFCYAVLDYVRLLRPTPPLLSYSTPSYTAPPCPPARPTSPPLLWVLAT